MSTAEEEHSQAGDNNVGAFTEEEANRKRQNKEEGVSTPLFSNPVIETSNCLGSRPSETSDY